MGDLKWLRMNGLEASVLKLAAEGTLVMGICGGYQMLGLTLEDPDGVEEGGSMRGMELLPVHTVFEKAKTRTRVSGKTGTITLDRGSCYPARLLKAMRFIWVRQPMNLGALYFLQ